MSLFPQCRPFFFWFAARQERGAGVLALRAVASLRSGRAGLGGVCSGVGHGIGGRRGERFVDVIVEY